MPLFDADFLSRLEQLSIVSRQFVGGQLLAQRPTRRTGGGVEFADHREYNLGDDFRYLDWNLYARHGELLLKRFHAEEDLHVYLMVDCSGSMCDQDQSKFNLARRTAAALAYIALTDLDRVSLCGFAQGMQRDFPLTRGKERVVAMLKFLEQLKADQAGTSLLESMRQFVARRQRPGLAVVVSDFYDPAGFENALNLLLHHRYEPHVIQIHLPGEANPALTGALELVDAESGQSRSVEVSREDLRRYCAEYEDFLKRLSDYCLQKTLSCTIASADTPFDELILRMLRQSGTLA